MFFFHNKGKKLVSKTSYYLLIMSLVLIIDVFVMIAGLPFVLFASIFSKGFRKEFGTLAFLGSMLGFMIVAHDELCISCGFKEEDDYDCCGGLLPDEADEAWEKLAEKLQEEYSEACGETNE